MQGYDPSLFSFADFVPKLFFPALYSKFSFQTKELKELPYFFIDKTTVVPVIKTSSCLHDSILVLAYKFILDNLSA
jgi:hypothetical protein